MKVDSPPGCADLLQGNVAGSEIQLKSVIYAFLSTYYNRFSHMANIVSKSEAAKYKHVF